MNEINKNNFPKLIFDIETDKIDAEIIRVVSWMDTKLQIIHSITDYEEMKKFFTQENVFYVGHYISLFDIPVVEKLLNIKVVSNLIDTCALSWILFPKRSEHGLESYSLESGVIKPKIADYANQKIEEIIFRCESDVKINLYVWKQEATLLNTLYCSNYEEIYKYIEYINLIMGDCAKQQNLGIKFDEEYCKESLTKLELLKEEKVIALKKAMPKSPIMGKKSHPKRFNNSDGSISLLGKRWLEFLKVQNFPENHKEDVEFVQSYEEGNPNSHDQIKKWLYNLGWVPQNIKHFRDKIKNEVRLIPQIKSANIAGEVCQSIQSLFEKEPNLEYLNGLFILSHRISLLKGFLRDQKEGRLYQGISGITNTTRWQHAILVNLTKIDKMYGENIRGCLVADEGSVLIGADLTALEDNTKQHFIYPYDPEYVKEMQTPGYCPHLDIAQRVNMLTKEQVEEHKSGVKSYKNERSAAKVVNFAATYNVKEKTLARNMKISVKEAKTILDGYWERNKSILQFENTLQVKTIDSQMWIFNPLSKFWYSLRAIKDKFSTINQSAGVFVMNTWVKNMNSLKIIPAYQSHDEVLFNSKIENLEHNKQLVQKAMDMTNEQLQMNVIMKTDIQSANRYSECH